MWIDRYPMVYPATPSTPDPRELADLAIVVRAIGPGGASRQRMLLMQGKVDTPSWKTSGSSPKEIDFLEKVPAFNLFTSSKAGRKLLGSFDLQSDFSVPPYLSIPFWSYLMFAPPNAQSMSCSPSHAYAAWPSSPLAQEPFFSCVVNQIKACLGIIAATSGLTPSHPPWGADVNKGTHCTQWRRLYLTLALHMHRKSTAALPGGKWKNTAPFGTSLPAFPVTVSNPNGTVGFASTGFVSNINPKPSHAEALAIARAFRLDSSYNGFQQDHSDAVALHRSTDGLETFTGIGSDEPNRLSPADGEDGPGFCMVFIDTLALEPDYRLQTSG